MKQRIWITWENQRRNHTLSSHLNAKLIQLNIRRSRFIRYLILPVYTIFIILRNSKNVVFTQNPSLVLSFISVTMGRLLGTPVIVDAHFAGLFPAEGKSGLLNSIAKYIIKNAKATIVTTSDLKNHVHRVSILPNKVNLRMVQNFSDQV